MILNPWIFFWFFVIFFLAVQLEFTNPKMLYNDIRIALTESNKGGVFDEIVLVQRTLVWPTDLDPWAENSRLPLTRPVLFLWIKCSGRGKRPLKPCAFKNIKWSGNEISWNGDFWPGTNGPGRKATERKSAPERGSRADWRWRRCFG